MRAIAIAALILLTAVACGSGHGAGRSVFARYPTVWQAASHLSNGCARKDDASSDVYGFLWLRNGADPLAYYLNDGLEKADIVSTLGDHFALWGAFWPCRTPVTVYGRPGSPNTFMTVLAPSSLQRKTITLGRFRLAGGQNRNAPASSGNAIVAANGRIIFFDSQTIRYAGGREFTPPELPHGWLISALAVSPRDPAVFLANANTDPHVSGGCRSNDEYGGVFLVTPGGSTKLKGYDACQDYSNVQWSPDGRQILWSLGAENTHLFISDARGRHLHRLIGHRVCGALWSPDGRKIAYGYTCNRAAVLDLSTGAHHFVGKGELRAWSPDGKELALIRIHRPFHGTGFPGGSVVAVPVTGVRVRVLIKLPATQS